MISRLGRLLQHPFDIDEADFQIGSGRHPRPAERNVSQEATLETWSGDGAQVRKALLDHVDGQLARLQGTASLDGVHKPSEL